VLNANDSGIAAVDVRSRTVRHVTHAGVGIDSLAIPPGGSTVWASQYPFGMGGDLLFLSPDAGLSKYKVGISGALTFSPTGAIIYVYDPGRLNAYDALSLAKVGTVAAGQLTNILQALPSPNGTRLYVSVSYVSGSVGDANELFSPGEIRIIDTATFKHLAAISAADGMGSMALTPDGSTLVFTANHGRVHLLSTATNKLSATIELKPANGLLNGLAVSPDGATAYVTDSVNNLLLVANLASQTQQRRIAVGAFPSPIVISPDGTEAWIATLEGLEIVDTTSGRVSAVALPGEPSAIAFGP
jgi:YVTN family beta-propeller protein